MSGEGTRGEERGRTGSELLPCCETRLKCPCSRDVANRVATTTEEEKGETKGLDELNAVGVPCSNRRQFLRSSLEEETHLAWKG